MNQKNILTSIFGIVFVLALLSFTSATMTVSFQNPSPYENSFNVTITSDQNESISLSFSPIQDSDGDEITFDLNVFSINANETKTVAVNYDTTNFDFEMGKTYSTTMSINGSVSGLEQETVPFERVSFCGDSQNEGNLDVSIDDISVNGFGDEDDYWYLFDTIEVDVRVENNGNWDMDNIEISWALYTTDGKRVDHGDLRDFEIREGDEETKTFSFTLDRRIDDFDSEDAILYVKAVGEIDDSDSPYDGNESCNADSLNVDVKSGDDFVILRNPVLNGFELEDFTLENETFTCGQDVMVNGDVWNIGNDDQRDVYITAYSKDLGIDKRINVGDIDAFEDENFDFSFTLPENLSDKWYNVVLEVYDRHDDIFENSEDDKSRFVLSFKVQDCHIVVPPSISAELESEKAISGKEMTIKVIIENNNKYESLYSIIPKDYEEWATLKSISGDIVRIAPGEATEVLLTFDINRKMSGDKIFNLDIVSDEGEVVKSQPIGVFVEESRTKVVDFIKANWKLGGIILLNLILIIAIIVVAARIYRK